MKPRLNKVVLRDFKNEFLLFNIAAILLAVILISFSTTVFLSFRYPGLLGFLSQPETIVSGMGAGILMLGLLLYGLRVNHRFSGPVLVLRNNLERLGQGDLSTRMSLRKDDRLKELSDSFNDNVQALDRKLERIKFLAGELESAIGGDERLHPLMQDLSAGLGELSTTADGA